jgi:hypothetical protein
MKSVNFAALVLLLTLFSSCELIGGIFKAGMWTGVIAVVGVIVLLLWLLAKAGRGKT